ncbi:hypothetical protein BX600DRAFT_470481 [Xylariales sp. PMI_506]|nr:hypothetical protein BX600DRAFT_470481 [Xylariales sp. PMI_506]
MDPLGPRSLHELGNLGPQGAAGLSEDRSAAVKPMPSESRLTDGSTPPPSKPRVHFNSSASTDNDQTSHNAADQDEPRRSTTPLKPRPALVSRNASYNSNSEGGAPDPAILEKSIAMAMAAQRAQSLATNEHEKRPQSHSGYPLDAPTGHRWSMDSATAPNTRVNGLNPQSNTGFGGLPGHYSTTPEAEELLKAHMNFLAGTNQHEPLPASLNASTENSSVADNAVFGNRRGGVFYQILQAYKNPPYQLQPEHAKKTESLPSSGATTPTRRKWYHEKGSRSQETLAQLVGASAMLANPNEKENRLLQDSHLRKRFEHKRSASGRIMSMMGLAPEEEARITIHVADILQRQKYIIKMCRALMLFGAPTHRLEEYLATTAKVLEINSQFLYIPGCMIISFDDVLTHTAEVKIVRAAQGVNLGKLKDAHDIYKEVLHDVIHLDEALARLDTLINAKDKYPVWVCVLAYGFASATVSTFFKARFIDMPIIFVLGTLLGFLQLVVAPKSKTLSTVFEISTTILMTFLSRAIASTRGGNLFCFSALTQSSIAMILPGWLVLSSALELHAKAVIPGSIRMVYAVIYSLFLGYGITVGTALYGAIDSHATTQTTCENPLSSYWNFLFVPFYLFFLLFTVQAKWKQMPTMIFIAFTGYVVNFWSAKKFTASAPIAYTFGAFAVGVMANLYSRIRHGVAAAVLLPAVYVQVPGSLASSGALTSGLVIANSLTNSTAAADTSDTQANTIIFNVAASMIQIAIGITVGLFLSTLVVYPLGKRRSGLWTL